jgi:hypothetical protein
MMVWIPDEVLLVSWALGGSNLQVIRAGGIPSGSKKIRDITIPYHVVRVLRDDLDQQRARAKATEVLVLAAQQSEKRLRRALRSLKLP